jgi:hypothetical protein
MNPLKKSAIRNLFKPLHPVDSQFDVDFIVTVTYNVESSTHCGYCSGIEERDIKRSEKQATRRYYFATSIDAIDIDSETMEIDLDSKKMWSAYAIPRKYCDSGSGYCGCGTDYTIIRAVMSEA